VLKISAVRPMTVRMDKRRYYVPEAGEDMSRYMLRSGDLLYTRYNGNPNLVANCAMVRVLDEELIYPDKLIRIRVDPRIADPEFVEALSVSPQARVALAPFIKSAAGQHGISGVDLKQLPIPLPSSDQQKQIVAKIRRSFSVIDRMADESSRATSLLNRLEQATLTKAFDGGLFDQSAIAASLIDA
jgi:type I restriction enzyme, S subunit